MYAPSLVLYETPAAAIKDTLQNLILIRSAYLKTQEWLPKKIGKDLEGWKDSMA